VPRRGERGYGGREGGKKIRGRFIIFIFPFFFSPYAALTPKKGWGEEGRGGLQKGKGRKRGVPLFSSPVSSDS